MTPPTRADYVAALKKKLMSRRAPKLLYHYSSSDGLLGILSEKAVWATNIWFLNDLREFDLALEMANRAVEERVKTASSKFTLGVCEVIRDGLTSLEKADVFVSSFSEHGDQLSQWRGYCPPGRGYSVGAEAKLLRRYAEINTNSILARCIYSEETQESFVGELVDDVIEFASENANALGIDRAYRESYKLFGGLLSILAPMLKDIGFVEEAEWRLVSLASSFHETSPEFRAGSSMLIPYFKHALSDQSGQVAIREIVVGPTLLPALACRAVEGLLERHHVTGCSVSSSSVPFRSW